MPYKERASITIPDELYNKLKDLRDKHEITWAVLFKEMLDTIEEN